MKRSELVFIPQLLQKYQMMPDRPGHSGVLPVGDPELSGGLPHNPGERRVVGMADMRTQMVDDVMVQPTGEPAHKRVFGRVIGCGCEDVIHAVVKLAAVRGKVGAVNGVGGLEDERYAQTDDQMNQEKRTRDQQGRSSQYQHRQDQHVGEVEALTQKEDGVFTLRVPGAPQVFVGGKEEALKVTEEHIVDRKQRVNEQSIDMLKPVPWRPGFIGRKAKDAAPRKRIIFAVEIDAGVMAAMVEDSPHVRVDTAKVE